ncbi:sulfotransferase [Dyella kyungheensis]|uniref:sulfotransferase family protein n=1 Tax=Dyella kyungheensis TaxID=1242174 RepID=UPI003CF503B2
MTDPADLYAQLVQAFNQRQWQRARELAARLLPLAPDHGGVYYIAGIASLELGFMPYALGLLHKATDLEPGRADFAAQFAKALAMVRRSKEALAVADRAMALKPGDPFSFDTLGTVYTQSHAHERAAEAFGAASELEPRQAAYRFNLATSLVANGDMDAAERALETCIALDPTFWKAHLTLAQLRKQAPASNHTARLELLAASHPRDGDAQTYLHMALAKEYEDLGDYARAFDSLTRGKAPGKAMERYTRAADKAIFDALIESFPFPMTHTNGDPTHEPIFVIGMPRSGTTLVERIISSHPDVYSAGELQNFGVLVKRLSGSATPELFDLDTVRRAQQLDWATLGSEYLASTRPATGHRPRFIDKLPHNFLYAGHIAHALPHAKIICLRRDPVDTCLSNFRQLFAALSSYYGYSFDLLDTGFHYLQFERIMAHWKRVMPGRVLEVSYEALVDHQEERSRELLAFCGLPWDERCLRFEANEAPVNTASAVQVRNSIYRTSMKRWKRYEAQLGPLLDLLTQAGVTIER